MKMKQKWQRPLELQEYLEKIFLSVRIGIIYLPGIRADVALLQPLKLIQKPTGMNQLLKVSTSRWRRWSLVSITTTDRRFQINSWPLNFPFRLYRPFPHSRSTIRDWPSFGYLQGFIRSQNSWQNQKCWCIKLVSPLYLLNLITTHFIFGVTCIILKKLKTQDTNCLASIR